MFVVLGLLVTPSRLFENGWHALAIAVFLMLVARPLAVYSSLYWFRYQKREVAYISWVGLRGAVPITLAMMPWMMGVNDSRLLFDVAFAVVIVSLLVQGASIPAMARLLKVSLPPQPEPKEEREIWLDEEASLQFSSYEVQTESDAEGQHPDAVAAGLDAVAVRCFALMRQRTPEPLTPETRLQAGDIAWYFATPEYVEKLAEQFYQTANATRTSQHFFGEFVLPPDALAGDLADAYGLVLSAEERGLSLRHLFKTRFEGMPVEGDRIFIGEFELTVKETDDDGRIEWLGLKVPTKKVATKKQDDAK